MGDMHDVMAGSHTIKTVYILPHPDCAEYENNVNAMMLWTSQPPV